MPPTATDWEQHYLEQNTGWDLGQPAPPLVRAARALPRCSTVVVGSGRGHDALALAELGFEVTGVDLAPSAVRLAAEEAKRRNLTARFIQADLLALPGAHEPWQLWVEHTCFCAIEPAQREAYVESARRSLVPGGLLLGLFYAHRRSGGPPYKTSRGELEQLFLGAFELVSMEEPKDSHPRRAGEELLALFQRRP